MRIVIDLQGAQSKNRHAGIGRHALLITRALIENRGQDEITIALSGLFPSTIERLRAEFSTLLPEVNIKVWIAPKPVSDCNVENKFRRQAAERIREAFLTSLEPDVVFIPSFFEGFDDDGVTSIGEFNASLRTVVSFEASSFSAPQITEKHQDISFLRKIHQLNKADALISLNGDNFGDVKHSLLLNSVRIEKSSLINGLNVDNSQLKTEAIKTLKLLRDIAAKTPPFHAAQKTRKLKLAFLSPIPPDRSGISDYSAELLPELANFYEIDVIVPKESASTANIQATCEIRTVSWFLKNSKKYDRVMYHFGNSYFHEHMFDLVREVPGVVVLHDFYLGDVQWYREAYGISKNGHSKALYESHGYGALLSRFPAGDVANSIKQYPTNLDVLLNASGVIIHSEHSRELGTSWYGAKLTSKWEAVPHLRNSFINTDKLAARERLGLPENAFIVCSFGLLGPTKLNHRLIESWLDSKLNDNADCILIFVGENESGEYGNSINKKILESGHSSHIRITGWADTNTFRDHLTAADLAVQLRTNSRGETSGTALDCMNYGLPTIVNSNGSLSELAEDSVWMLQDKFSTEELTNAIEVLWQSSQTRINLGNSARKTILCNHSPAACALQYATAIEKFESQSASSERALLKSIALLDIQNQEPMILNELATAIAQTIPDKSNIPTIYIDLSTTHTTNLKTGIERVARAITSELIHLPPTGWNVEPVYLSDEGGFWHYRLARKFTTDLLGIPSNIFEDEPALPRHGDIIIGLDISGQLIEANNSGLFQKIRNNGTKVYFMVHDLLPILLPHTFPPGADRSHSKWLSVVSQMDGAIGVSKTVAHDIAEWYSTHAEPSLTEFKIFWSHHGSDVNASVATTGLPANADKTLKLFSERTTFLMVGSIEPRKGYLSTLETFTSLWNNGMDVNLVIVGKEGWTSLPEDMRRDIPDTVNYISNHKELGRRLFWLDGITDQYLEQVYKASDCLIAASEGEGFGLPLIEAAHYSLPIIAKDIPVFREVLGSNAHYYEGVETKYLFEEIQNWITEKNLNPELKSGKIDYINWKQSSKNLIDLLIGTKLPTTTNHYGEISNTSEVEKRAIYIDVSVVCRSDFKTGIQRVVRSLYASLIKNPPFGYKVIPIFLNSHNDKWVYFLAEKNKDTNIFPKFSKDAKHLNPKNIKRGDIVLGLDLAGGYVIPACNAGTYLDLREAGAKVFFVVYDLLPIKLRSYFNPDDSENFSQWLSSIATADGILCISKSVKKDFEDWFRQSSNPNKNSNITISSFNLGADIRESLPTLGVPESAKHVAQATQKRTTFLMVGTLEPRKGHEFVINAFEQLWALGVEVNLIIVGKLGWNTDKIQQKITISQYLNKFLFWLNGISDEYLEEIYKNSNCLIAASEDEGYGLPLIEAAQHGIPIIARDIPVFREVASHFAYYFDSKSFNQFAEEIKNWIVLYNDNNHPKSKEMPILTWRQSADDLFEKITPKNSLEFAPLDSFVYRGSIKSHNYQNFTWLGFSEPEETIRWTDGISSSIIFDAYKGFGPALLYFKLTSLGIQKVSILFNSKIVYTGEVKFNSTEFIIPVNSVSPGKNILEFLLPDAGSPGNGDARNLSLAVAKVGLLSSFHKETTGIFQASQIKTEATIDSSSIVQLYQLTISETPILAPGKYRIRANGFSSNWSGGASMRVESGRYAHSVDIAGDSTGAWCSYIDFCITDFADFAKLNITVPVDFSISDAVVFLEALNQND